MLQLPNIYSSLKYAYDNSFPMKAVVGQLIAGHEKEKYPRPYAVVEIKPKDTDFTTGNYIQIYDVFITTWNNQNIGESYNIGAAFYNLFNYNYKLELLTGCAWTIQVVPFPIIVEVDERDVDIDVATDIFKITCRFEFYLDESFGF